MTKRVQSKFKVDRRYGVNLWGRQKSPVNLRNYKPGQHGQAGKSMTSAKLTPFGAQLMAKQKMRYYYGIIPERQFRRFYKEAARLKGDTGQNFVGLLERRLDAVVYHMKFASTIFASRQLVNHGHVLVNGRRVNIPSALVSVGDVIELKPAAKQMAVVLEAMSSGERDVPEYLEVNKKDAKGSFLRVPELSDVPYPAQMSPNLIVEWYSRRV